MYGLNQIMYYIIELVFAAGFGVASLFFFELTIIVGSSVFGSYLFARGLALIISGFPIESTMAHAITNGEYHNFAFKVKIYTPIILILTVLGIAWQIFQRKRDTEEEIEDRRAFVRLRDISFK